MRIIATLVSLVIFSITASAKNYYFSAVSGDDSRTSTQAQSSSTPWKTLTKLNSFFSSLQPGDSVLLKRGETFYGVITVNKSGTSTLPIVIGAYGTGNRPIVTGLQTLSSWTSVGSGKYECYNASLGTAVNILTMNDVEQAMGRYPNSNATNGGYLNFESHATNSITDAQLPSSPSWTGAELVTRTNRYVIDRAKITSHSGTKISYSPALSYTPLDGFGYFIQNDIRTLDVLGEWYYNPSTKKMTVYFGSGAPTGYSIKASAIENVVYIYDFSNIVLDNLNITGGNTYGIYLYSADNIYIKNCNVSFAGMDGIFANNTVSLKIENSIVNYANNIGINLNNSTSSTIRNNQIKNTALLHGMGQNQANKSVGIRETGENNLIQYNVVDSTGYIGLRTGGINVTLKNNLINHFNITKDDGGGIYTTSDLSTGTRKIIGNIVINGIGAAAGTNIAVAGSTSGIYIDDEANNVEITGNTVADCNKAGILIHNAHDISISQNTVFNNHNQQLLMSHNLTSATSSPLRNVTIKNNVLFAKDAAQGVLNISTVKNDASQTGTMDSNYYCRPLDDNFVIKTQFVDAAGTTVYQDCDLQGWKAFYKKDLATKRTAVQIMPHKVNALIGSNKFSNGSFNSDISGTNIYTTGTSLTKTWVSSKIDGGTLQVVTSSTKPALTTATVTIGSISTTKKYVISFSVSNSKDTIMYVYARQAGAPYNVLSNDGVKTVLRMNSSRKDYELAFIPTANEANATVFFETPSQSSTWWLDNIKIFEADVSLTNPDDSIRFEYNATQSAKTISLGATYTEARGTVYANSITLQPYTSAVLIRRNGTTTSAPSVNITSPAAASVFSAPGSITLTASASDADGTISKVDFYNGTTLLHTQTTAPYTWTWTNVAAGTYIITAKATDNSGLATTSTGVQVSVVTGTAPVVVLTSPVTNTKYNAPASITISATATDVDGTVSKVDFYNGTTLLHSEVTAPYSWPWPNVAAGTYTITAKATDNSGKVTTSPAVIVSVVNSSSPTVTMTSPTVNASFSAPATVTITATASDADGTISKVDFYNGTTLLHSEVTAPYTWPWPNVAAGSYTLTAKATDNSGNVTTSAAIPITVGGAPTVAITSPTANATFATRSNITITATAADADGTITKVEFYNGTTLLQTDNTAPYTFSWRRVSSGSYSLTARATDNSGKVTVSAAVPISVTSAGLTAMASTGSESISISDGSSSTDASRPAPVAVAPQAPDVKLYPNPAITKMQVLFEGLQYNQKADISVMDLLGKTLKTIPVIFTGQKIEIDVSSLNTGVYILRLASGTVVMNKKFVKTE